jgi:hypothetical protein
MTDMKQSDVVNDHVVTRPPARFGGSGARRWLSRHLRSSTSGIALLWTGWVIVVFYAVLWALSHDEIQTVRQWQATLIMIALGQSAVLTGLGLAVLDILTKRERRRLAIGRSGAELASGNSPRAPSLASPSAKASVVKRNLDTLLLPDGSLVVQTRLGKRRFQDAADAALFVGTDNAISSPPVTTRH